MVRVKNIRKGAVANIPHLGVGEVETWVARQFSEYLIPVGEDVKPPEPPKAPSRDPRKMKAAQALKWVRNEAQNTPEHVKILEDLEVQEGWVAVNAAARKVLDRFQDEAAR